ncbi:gliding motility-associated C-terminal domain-containing protein [Saccharicrinis carchari]|uniref:Gliding motility-associated C-terminal domain-containing protein n=1 Tax=Saccharicrinis carchari TaxID=1168039 RepID=A0A521BRY3_SACCC|nr:gliding motility-associated C-terminal domain-containing protein [Saccharicrinis carchari]SMO49869.1 gliding motility-associated C-terminal domain-containing protein [Saccharicrinis carchari]
MISTHAFLIASITENKLTTFLVSLVLLLFSNSLLAQTADFTANRTTVCAGSTVTFTDASTGITGLVLYTWDFGAGADEPSVRTGPGPHTVSYTGSGSSTVTLVITTVAIPGEELARESKVNYITRVPSTATILLTSANNTQTVCRNAAVAPITYSIGGSGTGATVTGLPAGVTGTFSGTTFTVSGTPTAAPGNYDYTVTTLGPCTNPTATGRITIRPDATIALTSGDNTQAVCRNTAIDNIVYTVGGSGTGATVTGLPAGVTGTFSGTTFTVSGTPTAAPGNYDYTVRTLGPCANPTASGRITIRSDATIALTSGNNTQTVCRNTAINPITYSIGGSGTGATVSGLPAGVTGSFSGNIFTISGTPTAIPANYNYTVSTTGPCANTSLTGTIGVGLEATILLNSGNTAQTVCVNTAITDITYTIGGSAAGASVTGLPAGVTGTLNGTNFTISGAPSSTGIFNYQVTTSGACSGPSATGSIRVRPNAILTLTSGNNTQTICANASIDNINYTVGGSGTGASVTGLPAGVTGVFNAGVFTISGTPSVSVGTFNYTVTATGTCANATATGTITMGPAATIDLTSGSDAQTVCVNTAISNIAYTIGGSATGASVTGLPAGVTGSLSGSVLTISGTPSVGGEFNYSVTTTGPCKGPTATGTIGVNLNPTIALTSGNNTQTVCRNAAIGNIVYTVGGSGTGATVTGLPEGVTGTFSGTTFTISGAPTAAAGNYVYTVTTVGLCTKPTATGRITIRPDATITLTSGNNTQTVCRNAAIGNIVYTVGGSGTGATVTGLPEGVTGTFSGTTFTISGAPTAAAGNYDYTVTTDGPCAKPTATGRITIRPDATITLTSSNNTQTVCRNAAIGNIVYTVGGSGTGATVSGLPEGVTGTFSGTTFTISGAPTAAAGNYDYTVTTDGPCAKPTATGRITIRPDATITLTSGDNTQTVCRNTAIVNIVYTVGGSGTGATVSRLPEGVTGTFSGTTFTISGTPTATAGNYDYTVTTDGPCAKPTATGRITIRPDATITLTSSNNTQTVCRNTAIANIIYIIGGTGTGATVSGLPAGVTGTFSGTAFSISGTPSAVAGRYDFTVTATGDCANSTANGTITVRPDATVNLTTSNNTQTVCRNTVISTIRYAISGSGTGATVSGLPAGVTGSYSGGMFTIAGRPTTFGTYNYTVRASGGSCALETATGSITVSSDASIELTSGDANATLCVNNELPNITYSLGGSGTGGSVTGLPGGVTYVVTDGVLTISGSPTQSGTFNYTVTASGGCNPSEAKGTIYVTTDASIRLTSNSAERAVCINNPISNIEFEIGQTATGFSVSGLPNGVRGVLEGKKITLSGTPSQSGIFNYVVVATGICKEATSSGTITVSPNAIITLTSANKNQSVCINNPIAPIKFNIGGSGNNATVTGLPNGVNASFDSGVFTISGTPIVSGTFNYRITATGSCGNSTTSGAINVRPDASIALTSANNEQTICVNSAIDDITYTIGASGNGATVTGLPTGVVANYSNAMLTISGTPSVSGTFEYTAIATGLCDDAQAKGKLIVNPLPRASISGTTTVCQFEAAPEVVFTGSMGIAPYTFTYTINSGSPLTVTTSIGNSVAIPVATDDTGTYTYSLLTVRDSGPSRCGQAQSGSATVVVNSLPTANISGSTQVCEGSSAPSILFSGNDGTAPYTFYYNINGGSTLSVTSASGKTATLPVATNTPGVYTYELLSVSDGSTSTCQQVQNGSATVTVNALPKAEISGTSTVCLNDVPVEVMFSGSGGTPPYTFSYTINDGDLNMVSTNGGSSVSVNAPTDAVGVFVYDLVGVQDQSNTMCENVASGSATISVSELPLASISGTTAVCRGSAMPRVTFVGSNGVAPYTFTYSINNGDEQAITTQRGNTVSVGVPTNEAGVYTYALLNVQDSKSNPCSNLQTGSATVQIDEIPIANPGTGDNNCGLTYIFSAQHSIDGATGKWTLTNGPGNATFEPENADVPKTEVTVDAFGTYEFMWTEVNGTCADQASITVSFVQLPSGNAGQDTLVCDLEHTLDAIPGNGAGSWRISEGPGNGLFSPSNNDPNAEVVVSEYGTYQFQWEEVNEVCQSSDVVEVIFREVPALSAGRDTAICLGDEVQLQAIGEGRFLWSPASTLDDASIYNPIASPVEETTYQVVLTDAYGCINTDELLVQPLPLPIAYAGEDTTLTYIFDYQTTGTEIRPYEWGRWVRSGGTAVFSDSTSMVNLISNLSVGENVFEWIVSNGICPDANDFLLITVTDLVLPTLITPNEDGINERFEIRGIETFGKTEFIVFDRRGLQVYSNKDYDNSWNGVDQNGSPLPEDTYYFSIKPANKKALSGYIVIRR